MKLLNYPLSGWKSFGAGSLKWNHYRCFADDQLHIGLIIKSADTFRKNPHDCSWRLSCSGGGKLFNFADDINELLLKLSGHKRYSFDEIDQGRKDTDYYIIKINKLKSFI